MQIVFLIACLSSIHSRSPVFTENKAGDSDAKMYRRVVQRLAAGEHYYPALGTELRLGHYNSRSVFNWRSPFHLTMSLRSLSQSAATFWRRRLRLQS